MEHSRLWFKLRKLINTIDSAQPEEVFGLICIFGNGNKCNLAHKSPITCALADSCRVTIPLEVLSKSSLPEMQQFCELKY